MAPRHRFLALLLIWQLAALSTLVLSPLGWRDRSPMLPSPATIQAMQEVLQPNADTVDAATQVIERHHQLHRDGWNLLQTLAASPESAATRLAEVGARGPLWSAVGEKLTRPGHPDELALSRALLGIADDADLRVLAARVTGADHYSSEWNRFEAARLLALTWRHDPTGIVALTGPYPWVDSMRRTVASALACPDPGEQAKQIGQVVRQLAMSWPEARLALDHLHWVAYESTTDQHRRAAAILALANDEEVPRQAVILARAAGLERGESLGEPVHTLASRAYQQRDFDLAVALAGVAASMAPGTAQGVAWDAERGELLCGTGYLRDGIGVLERVIDGPFNDLERGRDLMEAYRNRRHSAAERLAAAHAGLGDLVRAWRWEVLAAERYPERSWCGTCLMYAEQEAATRTFWRATGAGPAVLTWEMLSSPIRHLVAWSIVIVVGTAVLLVRRRLCRSPAS